MMRDGERCACGREATREAIIGWQREPFCDDCYANEFPEKAATFALARLAPNAGEFQREFHPEREDAHG